MRVGILELQNQITKIRQNDVTLQDITQNVL